MSFDDGVPVSSSNILTRITTNYIIKFIISRQSMTQLKAVAAAGVRLAAQKVVRISKQ